MPNLIVETERHDYLLQGSAFCFPAIWLTKISSSSGTFQSLCCLFILFLFHGQVWSLLIFRYFCYGRFLHYCFSPFLLPHLWFMHLVQSQLNCYSLLSFLRKISPFMLILFNRCVLVKRPYCKQRLLKRNQQN